MSQPEKTKKESIIAAVGTICFYGLLIALSFFFGLSVPLPLPEEQGVEVNLGNSDEGFGKNPDELTGQPQTSSSSSSNNENISTQSTEESVGLNQPKPHQDRTRNQPQQQTNDNRPSEPQVNQNALFPSRQGGTQGGGSEGVAGGQGNQGKPDGNPNATSYEGGGQGKGGGVSFSLAGRTSVSLLKPQYNSSEQGIVVVKIWVNKEGVVTKAEAGERGTTIVDRSLWRMASNAALQSRFSANTGAADVQTGTITYKFIKAN